MAEKKTKEDMQNKIQEIHLLEQSLQSLLMQKQAFQLELNETENAFSEIQDTKEDIFKVIGSIMIKSDKEKVTRDLGQKKELLSLRLKSIEKQESELAKQLEELRKEIMSNLK